MYYAQTLRWTFPLPELNPSGSIKWILAAWRKLLSQAQGKERRRIKASLIDIPKPSIHIPERRDRHGDAFDQSRV